MLRRSTRTRSKLTGRRQLLRSELERGELGDQVVVSVVVKDAGAVNVRARGNQEVRWRCAALVAATRKVALRLERRVLDFLIDPNTRHRQQIRKQLPVVPVAVSGPAGFEQKRSADRDCAVSIISAICSRRASGSDAESSRAHAELSSSSTTSDVEADMLHASRRLVVLIQ